MITSPKGWREQYERMQRSFARLQDNVRENFYEYEDDVVHFFMDCWHLKDWIKRDPQVDQRVRDAIESEISFHQPLLVAADLANGFKHFVLNKKPRAGSPEVTSYNAPWELNTGKLTISFELALSDKTLKPLQVAAQEAIDAWHALLQKLSLTPSVPAPAGP